MWGHVSDAKMWRGHPSIQRVIFITKVGWPMRIIILLALLMPLLVSAGSAVASAPPQFNEFRYTSDGHTVTNAGYNFNVMSNAGTGTRGTAPVPCGAWFGWLANEPADSDIAFGGTTFTFTTAARAHDLRVDLVRTNSGGAIFQTIVGTLSAGSTSVELTPSSFTVATGQYLGVMHYDLGCTGTTNVDTSSTTLTYSPSSPAYPTPELGTLVLAAAGIIGAGAFVAFRRFR